MASKRKASDVLLSLEKAALDMQKQQHQMDLNIKMILNKLNLAGTNTSLTLDQPKKSVTAKPVAGPLVDVQRPTMDDVVFSQVTDIAVGHRKSVVEQRITYPDGRPVILAAVKVAELDIPTNVIDKVRTDSHGKWHSQLFGGKYVVEVIKGPTAANRGFKMEYEIEVSGDGKPLSLERKQVE